MKAKKRLPSIAENISLGLFSDELKYRDGFDFEIRQFGRGYKVSIEGVDSMILRNETVDFIYTLYGWENKLFDEVFDGKKSIKDLASAIYSVEITSVIPRKFKYLRTDLPRLPVCTYRGWWEYDMVHTIKPNLYNPHS